MCITYMLLYYYTVVWIINSCYHIAELGWYRQQVYKKFNDSAQQAESSGFLVERLIVRPTLIEQAISTPYLISERWSLNWKVAMKRKVVLFQEGYSKRHDKFSAFCYRQTTAVHTLSLKVLNFWKFTSYCSLKPLWSGMGEVMPARTSPTLHPPSPSHCASIVVTSTWSVNNQHYSTYQCILISLSPEVVWYFKAIVTTALEDTSWALRIYHYPYSL